MLLFNVAVVVLVVVPAADAANAISRNMQQQQTMSARLKVCLKLFTRRIRRSPGLQVTAQDRVQAQSHYSDKFCESAVILLT